MKKNERPKFQAGLDELLSWFQQRMDKLPKTMQIDDATSTDNLYVTVDALSRTLRKYGSGVVFSGYQKTLQKIKDNLVAQGME